MWLNNGSGDFTDSGQSLGNNNSSSVALGDVDGDGDLDAFIANRGQGHRVWLNNGNGIFTDSGQSLGNHDSHDVTLGDVDGDGDLDAFVANYRHGHRVWLNDGLGIFTDSGQRLGDKRSLGVSLGDVDGDGDLDAFVANRSYGNLVWLNDGSGTFTKSGRKVGHNNSEDVALGDVDGDGDLDAIVANRSPGNLVWLNDGNGTFTDSGQSLGNHLSLGVSLGDVDGDGDLDAFVANWGQGNRVWINDGSGAFADSAQSLGIHASHDVTLGDVDGDGDLDGFVANNSGQGNHLWINRDAAEVVGRHIFYNNSVFDGQNDAANADDDAAIATDKVALEPGETASFANYINFSKGINGIMVDIANATDASLIVAADFTFRVSTDGVVWTDAPPPTSVTTRIVEFNGESLGRVTIIWPDEEIQNTWLEVTVAANPATTGLATPDVFYFGNAIGETGNNNGVNATVDVSDLIAMRQNASPIGTTESITTAYDFNRDMRVDLFDLIIVRDHVSNSVGELSLITAPSLASPVSVIAAAPPPLTVDAVASESAISREIHATRFSQQIGSLKSAMHQWRLVEWQQGRHERFGESRRAARHGQVLPKSLEGLGGESTVISP